MIGVVVRTDNYIDAVRLRDRLEQRRESGSTSAAVDEHRKIIPLKVKGIALPNRNRDETRHLWFSLMCRKLAL
ncbi:MAG: hypothetical protein ACYDDO_12090 [Acidiferrobacterales bacterium]